MCVTERNHRLPNVLTSWQNEVEILSLGEGQLYDAQVWFFLSFGNCMEEESILLKPKSGCNEENCKRNGLGWTHSSDEKLASALGYYLLVSVNWNSLAVLVYQFKSRILLYP